ncbi:MAG: hypothetical protein RMK94_16630, partial [Armatimonadota bacterium]|nr:hypothetical protein [Armatimonadota bacterium]
MRWLIVASIAFGLLLVGWTMGQKVQDEDVVKKVELLEKRLAQSERRIAELERKFEELRMQVAQLRLTQRFFFVP